MAGPATDLPDEDDPLLQGLPSSWVEVPVAKVSSKASGETEARQERTSQSSFLVV